MQVVPTLLFMAATYCMREFQKALNSRLLLVRLGTVFLDQSSFESPRART